MKSSAMRELKNFEELLELSAKYGYDPRLFQTWIPRDYFINGYIQNSSLTAVRGGEEIYALAIGPDPIVKEEFDSFSIVRVSEGNFHSFYQPRHEWDAYAVSAQEFKPPLILSETGSVEHLDNLADSNEIDSFIDTHAPDLSVRSGDTEVISWLSIRENKELLAIAALCRWQSGAVVISSVGVHSAHRNKGLGKLIAAAATEFGLAQSENVALGVLGSNAPAKRVYESLGYTLLGEFTSFSKRQGIQIPLQQSACCDH